MSFSYEDKHVDSVFIDKIWHTITTSEGIYTANLDGNWDIIITRSQDFASVTVNGIGKGAVTVPYKAGIETVGIALKPGVFLRDHKGTDIVDTLHTLAQGDIKYVKMGGHSFPIPDFDSAEAFVDDLTTAGLLLIDSVMAATSLETDITPSSSRTIRRHVLQTTGLTPHFLNQIERAKYAASLLRKGLPIAQVASEAGYSDQAHMTKSVKKIIGSTPGQLAAEDRL